MYGFISKLNSLFGVNFCIWWGKNLSSSFYMWLSNALVSFVEKINPTCCYCFGTFVENQLIIDMNSYFKSLNSVPLSFSILASFLLSFVSSMHDKGTYSTYIHNPMSFFFLRKIRQKLNLKKASKVHIKLTNRSREEEPCKSWELNLNLNWQRKKIMKIHSW